MGTQWDQVVAQTGGHSELWGLGRLLQEVEGLSRCRCPRRIPAEPLLLAHGTALATPPLPSLLVGHSVAHSARKYGSLAVPSGHSVLAGSCEAPGVETGVKDMAEAQ